MFVSKASEHVEKIVDAQLYFYIPRWLVSQTTKIRVGTKWLPSLCLRAYLVLTGTSQPYKLPSYHIICGARPSHLSSLAEPSEGV